MLYKMLNFDLHRLGITHEEAAQKAGITKTDLLLKLYGDEEFYIDELINIIDLLALFGGVKSLEYYMQEQCQQLEV